MVTFPQSLGNSGRPAGVRREVAALHRVTHSVKGGLRTRAQAPRLLAQGLATLFPQLSYDAKCIPMAGAGHRDRQYLHTT